ncbi:MAG: DNA repair protein RecO [Cellvibrionaceae bacterium]|nr:DNA repair protein RecO [Cellvibrionaceae bacterium]
MAPLSQDRAYVLHLRKYSDSRVILELLTSHSGVVHAVARLPGKRDRAKFEPFQPLIVELSGASELKTLRVCEAHTDLSLNLSGISLFCGLYINELMQRLLRPGEPFPEIFHYYERVLEFLGLSAAQMEVESTLRRMEFFILARLGFGIDFSTCAVSGEAVDAKCLYIFEQGKGFSIFKGSADGARERLIPGAHLLALATGSLSEVEVLKSAKYISRSALAPLLGTRPLKSRELFV